MGVWGRRFCFAAVMLTELVVRSCEMVCVVMRLWGTRHGVEFLGCFVPLYFCVGKLADFIFGGLLGLGVELLIITLSAAELRTSF